MGLLCLILCICSGLYGFYIGRITKNELRTHNELMREGTIIAMDKIMKNIKEDDLPEQNRIRCESIRILADAYSKIIKKN